MEAISNFKPIGSKMLYMLLRFGRMKDNNLLLDNKNDSEFLMVISNRNQLVKVEGKKEYLKQSFQQL